MAARKQEKTIFATFLFFLVIEDSNEEKIKSNVSTNFGSVKYFDNINKMDNSTDCLLNWDFMTENTFAGKSKQYKFQICDCLK